MAPEVRETVIPEARIDPPAKQVASVPVPEAVPASEPETQISPADGPVTVTTNFNRFTERTANFLGYDYTVHAGHYFRSADDPQWESAWCYTSKAVDGVLIQIDLVQRSSPSAPPIAPAASLKTLEKVGLSGAAALALSTKCAWLDERQFSVADFVSPEGSANPFAVDVPKIALNGQILSYSGTIGEDFASTLQAYTFTQLNIDSLGGLLDQAVEAGYWLRQTGKSIVVDKECLSACVFVLAGGTTRTASPTAQVGVHRFYSSGDQNVDTAIELAQETSSGIVQYLDAMGIDLELFHVMSAVPSQTMKFLAPEDMRRWRLVSGETATGDVDWFEALDEEQRAGIQTDLTLLGFYDVLIDGRFGIGTQRAIQAYQKEANLVPNGILTDFDRHGLRRQASEVYRTLGFELEMDEHGKSALIVPKVLLSRISDTRRGTIYSSSDGSVVLNTIAKPISEQSFADLFADLSTTSATRTVTYLSFNDMRFVVSGIQRGRAFYLMFYNMGSDSVGFSMSAAETSRRDGIVVSMFTASNFMPLEDFSKQKGPAARIAAVPSLYEQ